MEGLIVNGQSIDLIIIDWQTDCEHNEILAISHQWISSQNFLTTRMIGLERVDESVLTIEPLEDIQDFHIPP